MCAVAALIGLAIAVSVAAGLAHGAEAYSIGPQISCGQWTQDKQSNPAAYFQEVEWVLGYITGVNSGIADYDLGLHSAPER